MKTYLKQTAVVLGLLTIGAIKPSYAQPPLFNFKLIVENVSNPQIFMGSGSDKKSFPPNGENTFRINGRQSDYSFTVQYQYKGKNKDAVCEISGIPTQIIATIDPNKEGRSACKTQETGRG